MRWSQLSGGEPPHDIHGKPHNRYFWRHVNYNGPVHPTLQTRCWLWTGARCGTALSYGQTRSGGRKRMAHAVAWEWHRFPIPEDRLRVLDHLCRVTLCVNPAHLEYTTQQVNLDRAVRAPIKDFCHKGHPRDGMTNYGQRFCRECMRQHNRNHDAKKKADGLVCKPIWKDGWYWGRETFPGSGVGKRSKPLPSRRPVAEQVAYKAKKVAEWDKFVEGDTQPPPADLGCSLGPSSP